MFSADGEFPLPSAGGVYTGAAFDGCAFYFADPCRGEVTVTDGSFCRERTIPTRRSCRLLCFDSQRDCFWAAPDRENGALLRLDRKLREVDRLPLRLPDCPLTALSFCCGDGHLLASCGNTLWEIDPALGEAYLLREEGCGLISTVLSLPPYLLYTALREQGLYFVLASCDGRVLEERKAPRGLFPRAMLLDLCGEQAALLLLAEKHGRYPYFFRACLPEKLAGALCPCNRALCGKWEKEDCCGDLESIAMQEAALARILNTEGEKLLAVIGSTASPGELLRVNESVRRTIGCVTRLEQVLLARLEAAQASCPSLCEL